MDFAIPIDHRIKPKENEKGNKYLDLAKELKKTMEPESDGDTSRNWGFRYSYQRIGTGTGGLGNKRTSRERRNYKILRSVLET